MATTVKLQKIGNSVRATIPKDVVEALSLKQGEDMVVSIASDDSVVLRKKRKNFASDKPSQFYGILKGKTGKVRHWPSPEEIKTIWE